MAVVYPDDCPRREVEAFLSEPLLVEESHCRFDDWMDGRVRDAIFSLFVC